MRHLESIVVAVVAVLLCWATLIMAGEPEPSQIVTSLVPALLRSVGYEASEANHVTTRH